MPLKKAITADVASEIKPEDAIWLFKCLQHSTTDTAINVSDVAAALNAKPHTITCKISALKNKYNLNIRGTTQGSTGSKLPSTPRKPNVTDASTPSKVSKVKKENEPLTKKKRVVKALSDSLANGGDGKPGTCIKDEAVDLDGIDDVSNGSEV